MAADGRLKDKRTRQGADGCRSPVRLRAVFPLGDGWLLSASGRPSGRASSGSTDGFSPRFPGLPRSIGGACVAADCRYRVIDPRTADPRRASTGKPGPREENVTQRRVRRHGIYGPGRAIRWRTQGSCLPTAGGAACREVRHGRFLSDVDGALPNQALGRCATGSSTRPWNACSVSFGAQGMWNLE